DNSRKQHPGYVPVLHEETSDARMGRRSRLEVRMHGVRRFMNWLLDFFHCIARAEQVRPRCDDPLPGGKPLEDRHLVPEERARADGERLRHRSSFLLLQGVHEVPLAGGIMDERIDRYTKLLMICRLARDAY